MRALDLLGRTFGRLRVIERAAPQADGAVWWRCACECGGEKMVRGADLNRGFTQSCGCWRRDMPKTRATHGGSTTRLYRIWQAMHDRTGNPRASRFAYYGGRGISVCPEWSEFAPFQQWAMANGYADNLSIDRYPDNSGNYEPSNCRWATPSQQVRNRRTHSEMRQPRRPRMKTFTKIAAQGEITIIRVTPGTKVEGKPLGLERGMLIIGHSETQHDHVLEHDRGASVTVLDRAPEGMKILHMVIAEANALVHKRDHDTHETIALEPGEYEVRIAREFDHYAELARQSAD